MSAAMRLPRIAIVVAEADINITFPVDVGPDAWTLQLDTSKITSTEAPIMRGNCERVISLLRTYRDVLDHLIDLQSDTDARAIRRSEKEGGPAE